MIVIFKQNFTNMREAQKKLKEDTLKGVKGAVKGAVSFGIKTALTTKTNEEGNEGEIEEN